MCSRPLSTTQVKQTLPTNNVHVMFDRDTPRAGVRSGLGSATSVATSATPMWSPVRILVAAALVAVAVSAGVSSHQEIQQLCGGTLASTSMTLQTPGYPGRYPDSMVCQYWVQPASASVCGLSLDLGSMTLPPCPSSMLSVGGTPLCGVPAGQELHLPFIHPQTLVAIRGHPEGGEGMRFTLRQEQCSGPNSVNCGGIFSEETVNLLSPGYPLGYPEGADCTYTIRRSDPTICQIQVTFDDSNLEKSTNCTKDRLQINGDRLCGILRGVRTYGINGDLEIKFTSDFDGSGKGFNLTARQIRCGDTPPVDYNDYTNAADKQDSVDCYPASQGYPVQPSPYPAFPLPNDQNDNRPPGFPPYNFQNNGRYPIETSPPVVPPFRQNNPTNIPYQPTTPRYPFYRPTQNIPSNNYGPPVRANIPARYPSYPIYRPSYSQTPIYPVQPVSRQGFNQCCGQVYTDSHFLLVSPGFPRSQTTDCIYTISRYSPLTTQLKLQFRYFWAGEDTGTGCSGGFLEIDGTRVCGCKTGTVWTSIFFESETAKIIRLKLDYPFDRLFNGFVIEVLQDDSYSQRYIRSSELSEEAQKNDTGEIPKGKLVNFTQYVETVVDRYPVLTKLQEPSDKIQPDLHSSQLVDGSFNDRAWDSSSRQSADFFCLRWNWQDWILLAKEVLWSKYQCPVSSNSSSSTGIFRSDTPQFQPDPCQRCFYFCQRSCQC